MTTLPPFIKWTGSKRHLAIEIIKKLPEPEKIDTFVEPFVGGGSVFTNYINFYGAKRLKDVNFYVNDINSELIKIYSILKDSPQLLVNEYAKWRDRLGKEENINNRKQIYNELKAMYNSDKSAIDFFCLTRFAYNGLIRFNAKGEFNTSYHLTRKGIETERLKQIINKWCQIINSVNVTFTNEDASDFVSKFNGSRVLIFSDPPYMLTKASSMYGHSVFDINAYANSLDSETMGILTYDQGIEIESPTVYSKLLKIYPHMISLNGKSSNFRRMKGDDSMRIKESLFTNIAQPKRLFEV